MDFFKKPAPTQGVQNLAIHQIYPNPAQPRKIFRSEELESLSLSIQELGILQPLTVRKVEKGWELIAGERRLRAAQLAGLSQVPCLVMEVQDEISALLALVENIQRQDLDFMEEAQAIAQLITNYHLSQEEVAKRIGKSQSAVANLLRLLRLSPLVVDKLRESACTQRHARALLKLPDQDSQLEILEQIHQEGLNVAQSELLIQSWLNPQEEPPPSPKKEGRSLVIVRDVRLFLNSIAKSMDLMKTAGVNAQYHREDGDTEILLTIRIPR